MDQALVDMLKSVPGLAFGALVFWLVTGLWNRQIDEQKAEREAHRAVIDAIVQAFEKSVETMLERSDARQKECSDRCIDAVRTLNGGSK